VIIESDVEFGIPNEQRKRSLLVKNMSFENLSRSDLFTHGWHKSGYRFGVTKVDTDGWIDGQVKFTFPRTSEFKKAYVEIVRFPSRTDYDVQVDQSGSTRSVTLGLDTTERIVVPLSANADSTLTLSSEKSFPLSAPDTRSRSFRVVNIDFE
jgi:hypothetical protein